MKRTHNPDKNINVIRRIAILVGAIITALALALTFALSFDSAKRVSVDNAEQGEVATSAAFENLASGTDKSAPNALNKNDTITYTTTGSVFSIKLPAGTFILEAWGGQGGTGLKSSGTNAAGGKGGHTKATYTIDDATTIYIAVGGMGGNRSSTAKKATMAGGYNGGGAATTKRTCQHGGGGGGGATHFATATGELSSLSTNQAAVLLVAGGGGGAGTLTTVGGMGGGTTVTTITGGYVAAGGAASNAAGGSTSGGACTGSRKGATGAFGKGGDSGTYTNYAGGAGGGAGWYGGAGGNASGSCSAYPAGGGSSYIKSTLTSRTFEGGTWEGAGKAMITVVSVNKDPVSSNASVTLQARGGNTTQIAATTLATDPDKIKTAIAFTGNNSTNYDTLAAANQGLWFNSACTNAYLATKYFDWNWSDGKLNITNVKKYPRSGIDGSTADGKLTLYTYVRDTYGTDNKVRGVARISFTVTVGVNTIAKHSDNTTKSTATGSPSVNSLKFGMSNASAISTGNEIDTSKGIYNPLGPNRYTAIFEQPLRYNQEAKINVSDLVTATTDFTATSGQKSVSLDRIVASINSVASITGASRKYAIIEHDTPSAAVTAYNASKTKLSNVYETLTFKCITPDPAYQVLSLTIYRVEKAPVLGSPYTENVVPGCGAVTIDIVFKMDNTRPVLRNDKVVGTGANRVVGPVVKVQTLSQVSVNLNDYFMDVDGTNNAINATTHQIKEVVVPTYEYVQTNRHGEFTSTQNTQNSNKSYFNVLAAASPTPADRFSNLVKTGQLKGDAYKTGFESWYIYNPSVTAQSTYSDVAFVQYSFSNATLTLTGLRATHSMYKDGRTSLSAITGGSIAQPTTTAGVDNAGHFYILIRLQDKNDVDDDGIWLPLGIEITNKAPTTMQTERNGAGAGEMPTASGAKGSTFYFTPMGITYDKVAKPIGVYEDKSGNYTSDGLKPLASDADNYYRANMLNGNGKLNEFITIASDINELGGTIDGNSEGHYFTVEPLDVYVPESYFGWRVPLPSAAEKTLDGYGKCVKIQGIKITLNNWTHNRYIHLDVDVVDSATAHCTTQIAIYVNNQAPKNLSSSNIALLNYETDGVRIKSELGELKSESDVITIKYSVPVHEKIIVSPYDLLTDGDMDPALLSGGFTLNGLSGRYNSVNGVFTQNSSNANDGVEFKGIATSANEVDYSDSNYLKNVFDMLTKFKATRAFGKVTTDNRFSTPKSGTTYVDQLYFARTTDDKTLDGFTYNPYSTDRAAFVMPEIIGKNFVSYSFGNKIIDKSGNSYNIDYAVIETNQRTASGSPAVIEFSVRDRTGAGGIDASYGVRKIRVEINVVNSSPFVKSTVNPFTLSAKAIYENGTDKVVTPDHRVINAADILDDREDGEVRINTNVQYQVVEKRVDADGKVSYIQYDVDGKAFSGNYVDVAITQSTITVAALNSTQAIKELYIKFSATDGRYDDRGVLEASDCYIRIEVVNSVIDYNTGDNGFTYNTDTEHYLWNVESMTEQDKTRTRYFVSGSVAADLVSSEYSASASQIRYLVSDYDALQGVVLSPASTPLSDSAPGYINAKLTAEDKAAAYRNAVPQLSTVDPSVWASEGNAVAAILSMRTKGRNSLGQIVDVYTVGDALKGKVNMETNKPDIIYFVEENGGYKGYNASDLKTQLTFDEDNNKSFANEDFRKKFFDDNGRWIVTNWAIAVTPNSFSTAEQYINLQISLRDDAKLGGDTAGKSTAYKAGTAGETTVKGNMLYSYDMFVNNIGIVAYTYYNQYNGYYTVADAVDENKVYVPTYDGSGLSKYVVDDITTEDDIKSLYLANNVISTDSAVGTKIKTRGEGEADNTKAGVHSGILYDSAAAAKGYTFPAVDGDSKATESAFKYSDTIYVSNDKDTYTYVPMSYFALNKSIATETSETKKVDGNDVTTYSVVFPKNDFVSYDVGKDYPNNYARKNGYLIGGSVIIRDNLGGEWTANEDNPYVVIDGFDVYGESDTNTDALNVVKSPYYNNCLSIPTYASGKALASVSDTNYGKNISGANGRIMYLEKQDDLNDGLQEHMFGLKIKKANTRARAGSVTITIKVVQCSYDNTVSNGNNIKADYGTNNNNAAEVTFKLEIDNSPITLVAGASPTNSVAYDTNNGYYYTTMTDLNIESGTQYLALTRNVTATAPTGSGITIRNTVRYADADKVETDGVIDTARSDQAKFSLDSLKRLGSFTGYTRVFERSGGEFTNVSTDKQVESKNIKQAQESIKNYFGSYDVKRDANVTLDQVNENYRPNGGIYAGLNNEGYENYFSVGLSADGTRLSITPKAKTVINADLLTSLGDNSVRIGNYYKARGLVYDATIGGGYYPLKVLIYDDHGDGFSAASYVALEIRVAIKGTAARLSDNLDSITNQDGEVIRPGKKLDVSLGIGTPYSLNISRAIVGGSLLKKVNENGTTGNIFWEEDYKKLKGDKNFAAMSNQELVDMSSDSDELNAMFMLESGTYLISPFASSNNIHGYTLDANKIEEYNSRLRAGTAVYSSNPGGRYGLDTAYMPDVIMYMDYHRNAVVDGETTEVKDGLAQGAIPEGDVISFRVNRRTTYTYQNDNGQTNYGLQNNFTFKLTFTDSDGNVTSPLEVNIEVVNQAPTIRGAASEAASNLLMQVGDSFTVLTTPYNRFVGASVSDEYSSSEAYTTPSTSAMNSKTYNTVTSSNGVVGSRSLLRSTGDEANNVKFEKLTGAALQSEEFKLHSYEKGLGQQHLGYVALADDDMPWGLRIYNVSYYDDDCFDSTVKNDTMPLERDDIPGMKSSYPLSVVIVARSVCKNMPVTFTVVDSDGALTTFTMYVTVESSMPSAIIPKDGNKLNNALNFVTKTEQGETVLDKGVYQLYMISNNVTDKNDPEMAEGTYKDVTLDKEVTILDVENTVGKNLQFKNTNKIMAYGKVRIPINEVAYDPDTNDKLLLYAEEGNSDYNVMLFNGAVMPKKDKSDYVYSNGYFTVEVSPDYSWFTIECKTYNPNSDEDILSFYVRDDGNNVIENRIGIQIRINTLYSSITNAAQMTSTAVTQEKFVRNYVSSVNVKSFDDYSGLSIDLPEDEKDLAKIKNVDSTFQFLTYAGMPTVSVDQTDKSAKPMTDPDVVLNNTNLNYELRIYAFMDSVEDSASEFKALSLDKISELFYLDPDTVNTKVLALRSTGADMNKYLIGGSFASGIAVDGVNRSLILFLQRYFMFDVGEDGVSLRFRPISANLGVDIPLYVQIKKVVDDNRTLSVNGVSTTCGNIFYMNVLDSAPRENTEDATVRSFSGKVGESVIFKMYDKDDPYGSLFTDSDLNDVVMYDGYVSATVQNPDYNKAFAAAGDLDWKADEVTGKKRAVDIEVNNTAEAVNGMPAYSVKITINRRIDVKENGKFLDAVPLPITLFCKDRGGKSVSTELKITIQNSNIDIDKSKLTNEIIPDTTNGYYVLSADAETDRLYYIDAYVSPYKDLAPFNFVSREKSYISDTDYTTMKADTDSMRLVGKDSDKSSTYLMYNQPINIESKLEKNVATVTPIFGNENMPADEFHFVGFSIKANTKNRLIDDATATMRIIDKSGDPTDPKNGFTVTLRIHILNAAPTLKKVENKPFVITGSESKDGSPIVIDIDDYITDINGDKVRIVGLSAAYNEDESKDNIHSSTAGNGTTGLVDMTLDDKDNTKCSFTSKKGFYGDMAVSIMVADIIDSEDDTQYDYAVVEFQVYFVVGYDISEITLKDMTATRSLPTEIDVEKLFDEIKDTYGITDSTQEAGKFNPGSDYVITDVTASGVKIYKDGDKWMFVSEKEADQVKFNVTFKNKSALDDPNVKSVTMSFNAAIGKNTAPQLLPDFKNHTEEGFLFQTSNKPYGLDNNGTVALDPTMLFSDKDSVNGDELKFDPKSISVSSPTICSVRVSEDGTLYLTFNCRGECDFTVGVMDRTGETTKATFKVKNIDRPEPSFWNKITISYEEYPLIWWGVGIGLLVLIALIILIILLAKRRKRKQEELEAILISEMELEEQMMRLNAGAMGAMPYQSYGYLPPTMNVQNDPNLMLGGGGTAPDPGSIGLNPGGSGVPTDSDM